ncbi:hypothetical protein GCM10009863_29860 [Streptomyces axinellae]|uniref:Uncharacterized protein n=1 Tax=Streptomyces axinellae TaxID=552788 RepID=A0ABN3Q314_9ACTN
MDDDLRAVLGESPAEQPTQILLTATDDGDFLPQGIADHVQHSSFVNDVLLLTKVRQIFRMLANTKIQWVYKLHLCPGPRCGLVRTGDSRLLPG